MKKNNKSKDLLVDNKKIKKKNRRNLKNISGDVIDDGEKREKKYDTSLENMDLCNVTKYNSKVNKNSKKFEFIKCLFSDSIDDPLGDARKDFIMSDPDNTCTIWCIKDGHRLFPKLCGRRVTKKCKSKLKCEYYDYGMAMKGKYNLKLINSDIKRTEYDNYLSLSDTNGKDLYEDC